MKDNKCPKCDNKMDKGGLATQNESWIPEKSALVKSQWLVRPPAFGQPRPGIIVVQSAERLNLQLKWINKF